MDIWLIQDGEKSGPIHDFEIRRKIEAGELDAATPAWHEGLAGWRPLSEISLFHGEFERLPEPDEPSVEAAPQAAAPPPPEKPALFRRFWARWFDLYLFAGVWWLAMWAAGRDIEATLENAWVILFQYIPWFVLEVFLLHRFGTTFGKALLGLKVTNNDGSLLNLKEATRRSLRVLILGIGLGWGLLPLICQTLSFFTARRLGKPLWDYAGGHLVRAAPLRPLRLFAFVLLFFGAIQLQMIVISPYVVKRAAEMFPTLKADFEKNPPWHLPERSRKK